ncbi:hypothetical protein HPP92_015829 [Vanilla planifolia]|uniref:Phytocyanin domain-containing protein n=1 Tax=Vanilla planifolia TaxID=51239 RepID=A0A835QGZ8_VANPL|nr:hypothetical protein HPP92_027228 [Vanilla planifolia]KAG0471283.1 hypothetical protein HPP92_015829 [Vanilla planifolia]
MAGNPGASVALIGAFFVLVLLSSSPVTTIASKINVGGPVNWTFGFNYTDWALKSAPFYVNDTLVFKYDPPNSTTHAHSVYLAKDLRSFLACDMSRAQLAGDVMRGAGEGFQFVLRKRKTYFFVCGEKAGFHCSTGLMRFFVRPVRRCHV